MKKTIVCVIAILMMLSSAAGVKGEPDGSGPSASQVVFERSYENNMEQAVITGTDEAGQVLWSVQTDAYPAAQLMQCCDIGIRAGKYYYTEGGAVITLDLADGSRIWENTEFHGSSVCSCMDENGTLYICGYYGPDLFIVDKDGHTLSRTQKIAEGYNWPYRIELQDGMLTIWYEQNGASLQVPLAGLGLQGSTQDAAASSGADASSRAAASSGADASAGTDASSEAGAPSGSAEEETRLHPASVTASSELEPYYSALPPYPLYTYYASYIDDGDMSTAWNEGVAGDGTGEYLELVFPEGTVLTGGVIWPGFYETSELFYQNNAPVRLEVSSGGTSSVVEIGEYASTWQEGFQGMPFRLDPEIVSDGTVRVTMLDIRKGNTYDDACITELYFTGRAAGPDAGETGEDNGTSAVKDLSEAEPGDIVAFGQNVPEQADQGTGPLYWQVLAGEDGDLLLISRDVLKAPPYDDDNYYPVWGDSYMRSWLNGDFYQTAFTEEERGIIRDSGVTYTTMLQEDGTWGQESTIDKVFLLNSREAEQYFSSNEARRAVPAEGASGMEGIDGGYAAWWLIGVGFESQGVQQVTAAGEIDTYGTGVNHLLGVRPVIRVAAGAEAAGTEPSGTEPAATEPSGQEANDDPGNEGTGIVSESGLRDLFSAQIQEPILYFLYDDYDYNGTYEAMAVTEQPGGTYVHIWFIDGNGSITDLTGGRSLYGYEFQDSANVRQRYLVDTGTQKFYVWENCAGGSGSTSFIFGVKNGYPYEPQISGIVQSFQKEGEDFVHYGNDFSQGFHDYPRELLIFDPGSGEFFEAG